MAVIVFASSKGGVAKTTMALNIMHQLGVNEAVDLDAHKGLAQLNRLRVEPFLIHCPENIDELAKLIRNNQKGEYLIIDCGGYDSPLTRVAIGNADAVIIPSNDAAIEQFGLTKVSEILSSISSDVGRTVTGHVLVNRVHHAQKKFDAIDAIVDAMPNLERLNTTIPYSKKIIAATDKCEAIKNGTIPVKFGKVKDEILKLVEGK